MAPPAYYGLVVPGIEDLATAELRSVGATVVETLAGFDKRDSVVTFADAEPARVLRCGLLDDVFQVVLDAPTPATAKGAKLLASSVERTQLERAMAAHHALRPKSAKRSYKVVARVAGRHPFKREDVERAFIAAIGALLPRWSAAGSDAAIELWVHVIGGRTIAGLRLSGDELAQRRYKRAHLPASLTPTVARALVTLAEPQAGDVVLDPMCGAGTILRERAEAARAALIVGGDIAGDAVEASRVNAGKQAALARWDATRLPLRGACVDSVVMNPPYGRQHEAVAGLDRLYARAMREVARVLRPGGRAVVLTGEPAALGRALPQAMRIVSKRRMLLRGLAVTAFVLERA
jgi:tRNA G10  N-methylase Trm11